MPSSAERVGAASTKLRPRATLLGDERDRIVRSDHHGRARPSRRPRPCGRLPRIRRCTLHHRQDLARRRWRRFWRRGRASSRDTAGLGGARAGWGHRECVRQDQPTIPTFLDVEGEPWSYYELLRAAGGIVWDDAADAWIVSSHKLVREVAKGEGDLAARFAVSATSTSEHLPKEVWDETQMSGRLIQSVEGSDHDRQHRWWMRTFTPRVMSLWQEKYISPACNAAIDRIATAGRADLRTDYADRIPPRFFTAIMGYPEASDEFVAHLDELFRARSLLRQMLGASSMVDPEIVESARSATRELKETIWDFVMSRRDGSGEDLISLIWRGAAELYGTECTDDDVVATVAMVWDNGTHTTIHSIANALYLLLTQPELRSEIERNASLVPQFVEESLRIYGPVFFTAIRIALKDFELGDVHIAKGARLVLLLGAAGHDPHRYHSPDEPTLTRDRPRDHLSFYAGRNSCIGQMLARAELEESVRTLLERLPDVQLDPSAEPPDYQGVPRIRAWSPLNVRFTPSPIARLVGAGMKLGHGVKAKND